MRGEMMVAIKMKKLTSANDKLRVSAKRISDLTSEIDLSRLVESRC